MRAFIALTLPETVRHALHELQRELSTSRADVRWVNPQHLHVTLKFLDEITEPQRRSVEAMLVQFARETRRFPLELTSVGAFPSMASPRVVWVGLGQGREAVIQLADAIEAAGEARSLRRESRPFAAHVTIGRVRSARQLSSLTQRLQHTAWQSPLPWVVTSLTLYESRLGSDGPTYTVLADVPLKSGD